MTSQWSAKRIPPEKKEKWGGEEVCNRFLTILPPFYYKLFVLGGKKDSLHFQTFYFPSDPGGINFRWIWYNPPFCFFIDFEPIPGILGILVLFCIVIERFHSSKHFYYVRSINYGTKIEAKGFLVKYYPWSQTKIPLNYSLSVDISIKLLFWFVRHY